MAGTRNGDDRRGEQLRTLIESLQRLRRDARALLVARAAAVILAAGLGVLLVLGAVDYLLRLPAGLRVVLWLGGVALLGWGTWRLVRPALQFRPSLTDLALRVESLDDSRRRGLAGVIASSVELRGGPAPGEDPARAAELLAIAEQRVREVRPRAVLEPGRSAGRFSLLAGALATTLVVAGVWPHLAGIGAARLLAPWSGAQWPRRTMVVDATPLGVVHPLGVALPVRGVVTRTNRAPGETPVRAEVRLLHEGRVLSEQRVLLTAQRQRERVSHEGRQLEGEVYERPVDTRPHEGVPPDAELTLEYRLVTLDDASETQRVRLVAQPAVRSATLVVEPPTYARSILGAEEAAVRGRRDLGAGDDARAAVGPILAGSRYELQVALNKAVPALAPGAEPPPWLAPLRAASEDMDVEVAGDRMLVAGRLLQSAALAIELRDAHGLSSAADARFAFEVLADAPPSAAVTRPTHDEAVLATAQVSLEAHARDDLALAELALERQIARPPAGSQGAPPEPTSPPRAVAVRDLRAEPLSVRREASLAADLDLSPLGLGPGDEVWVTALASDTYELAGAEREPVRSRERRLIVIEPHELAERLRAELATVRDAAIRLDDAQSQVSRQAQRLGATPESERAQAAIGEQVAAQRDLVDRLAERAERNRLEDAPLEGLLGDASASLAEAQRQSARAGEALEQARQEPDDQQARREAADAQDRVRDELGRLADMLGRGQDEWLMRRALERLIEQQRALQEQTAQAGAQTMGQQLSALDAAQLSELERIAQRQQDAADAIAETLDELNERARQLADADPAQSAAMRSAAQRGRQARIEQQMRDAAEQVAQNQTRTAGQRQQQAMDAMQEMLEDLEDAQKNRDAQLRRVLASIIESLETLIAQQQRELDALDRAHRDGDLAGLDATMIALHGNTLGVLDQVRREGRELEPVAALIEQAVSAQEAAIAALRRDRPDADAARQAEQTSLERLKDARDEAERLQAEAAERDQARRRAELRRAYRDALERQVAIRGETEPFVGRDIGRRERQAVRGLAADEQALAETLDEIQRETEGMDEAAIFELAHRRLDRALADAADRLARGEADATVLRRQGTVVTILQSLVEALAQAQNQEDPFREGGGGGGGQGGGGGGESPLIPPMAELKLLRAMQSEALTQTREAEGDAAHVPEAGELQRELESHARDLLQRMQQQRGGE